MYPATVLDRAAMPPDKSGTLWTESCEGTALKPMNWSELGQRIEETYRRHEALRAQVRELRTGLASGERDDESETSSVLSQSSELRALSMEIRHIARECRRQSQLVRQTHGSSRTSLPF